MRHAPPTDYHTCLSQWAETALASLVQLADEYVTLNASVHGTSPGPWSVADKDFTPPSGDKRDFQTKRGEILSAIAVCVCVRECVCVTVCVCCVH